MNGNFERGRPFFGSVGGQIMQFCLAILGISQHSSSEDNKKVFDGKKEKNPAELLKNPGLISLLLSYLKDMKNDAFSLQISQHTAQLLEQFKVNGRDLSKLNEEQLQQIRHSVIQHPGHLIFQSIRNSGQDQALAEIYESVILNIVDILSKKVSQDINFNLAKLDQIIHKIKLIPIPKQFYSDDQDNLNSSFNQQNHSSSSAAQLA